MSHNLGPLLDLWGVDHDPDKGGNQKVNCPNPQHEDVRASASVNMDEGLLNCFGCGLNGDAIKLLIEIEGLEFVEAKRRAEELAGQDRPAVSRQSGSGDGFLPRRKGSRSGGRSWSPPWAGRRS